MKTNFAGPCAGRLGAILAAGVALFAGAPAWSQGTPADAVEVERNVEYGKAGEIALKLDVYRSATPSVRLRPALLVLHGGGWKAWPEGQWDKTSPAEIARAFAAHGYWVASIEYRLSDVAPFPAALEDCRQAVRFVRSHAAGFGVDPGRIGAWGFSAGGHLALLLGLPDGSSGPDRSARIQAVSSWSGPTDFTDRTGDRKLVGELGELVERFVGSSYPAHPDLYGKASPISYASREAAPVFLVHGDQDRLVPFSHSRLIQEKLQAAGAEAELLVVKGGGHLFFNEEGQDPPLSGMIRSTLAFFDRHLKAPRVLFLTHSAGFLHDVVKRASPDALSIAEERLKEASRGHFDLVPSQDLREVSPEQLKGYAAVVFYTSGELPINTEALLDYVRTGGAFVCVHNAMATLMKYPPYSEMVGGYFDGHPWNQEVAIKVEDREHPSTLHLEASFRIKDEIYQVKNWDRKKVHVLLSIDPSSVDLSKGKREDHDYALAWTKSYGKGRVFYTALGHYPDVWKDERFLKHLVGGIEWALAEGK